MRAVLGKMHKYVGSGRDPMADRVYVREKIKYLISQHEFLIKSLEVKVPARILNGGRKEIVILSGILTSLRFLYYSLTLK